MSSYASLIFYLGLAELLRRCSLALIEAFTGPLSKIPGPLLMKISSWPWALQVIKGTQMNLAPELFSQYGDTVRVSPNEVIFSSKNAILKIVVEDDLLKSPQYGKEQSDPKITSLISERDRVAYKQKRRLLSPGFSISYLNGLEPLMQQCVQAFAETLDSMCTKGQNSVVVDMYGMMSNLTSDVMGATSFGGSFDSVRTNDNYMKTLFLDHLIETAISGIFPFLRWLPFLNFGKGEELNKIIDLVVSKRRNSSDKDRKDLLQIMLDTHENNPATFTDMHLKEEMHLFMIAGSDTTGTAAAFTVLLLVNNQDRLESLKAEIDKTFPSKDDPITFSNTQDLPYLNAVINESQRVMPIVTTGLPRVTTESTIIGKYEIPPKTLVTAWLSSMFKDPSIWPDPEDFIPERWLGKYKGVDADRKAFIPFSAGSRNCIGQQFALRELRLILATLIRRYDLSLIPGQSHELKVHVVPYFASGKYLVGIKLRD